MSFGASRRGPCGLLFEGLSTTSVCRAWSASQANAVLTAMTSANTAGHRPEDFVQPVESKESGDHEWEYGRCTPEKTKTGTGIPADALYARRRFL